MSTFEYVMVFAVSWWLCLFLVLPFHNRRKQAPEGAEYPASPDKLNMARILLITTLIAFIFAGAISWAIHQDSLFAWLASLPF